MTLEMMAEQQQMEMVKAVYPGAYPGYDRGRGKRGILDWDRGKGGGCVRWLGADWKHASERDDVKDYWTGKKAAASPVIAWPSVCPECGHISVNDDFFCPLDGARLQDAKMMTPTEVRAVEDRDWRKANPDVAKLVPMCEWCGPRCQGGACHNARREERDRWGSLPGDFAKELQHLSAEFGRIVMNKNGKASPPERRSAMDEQRVDVDWTNHEAVVKAFNPRLQMSSRQQGTQSPSYFLIDEFERPVTASFLDENRPWGFFRSANAEMRHWEALHNPSKRTTTGERRAIAVGGLYQAHSGAIFIPRMIDSKGRLVGSPVPSDATLAPARSYEAVTPDEAAAAYVRDVCRVFNVKPSDVGFGAKCSCKTPIWRADAHDCSKCGGELPPSRLEELALTLAYEFAVSVLETDLLSAGGDWMDERTDQRTDELVPECMEYLELRGLVERHSELANWFKVRDESEATQ